MRSEQRAAEFFAIWEGRKDISLDVLRQALTEIGLVVSVAGVHRFFAYPGVTRNKTYHTIEQDGPNVLKQRRDWFEGQTDLEPERLVFIDETWTATIIMSRGHGRCLKGERLRMGFSHGHRKITT